MLDKIWIIPALPALSFVLILAFGRRLPGKGHEIGIPMVALAFVLALIAGGQWMNRDTTPVAAHALSDVSSHCSRVPAQVAAGDVPGENAAEAPTEAHSASEAGAGHETEEFSRPIVKCATWFHSGATTVTVGTLVDGQSLLLLVIVTLVSLLVHIFSTDYVGGDRRYTHYFGFLSLFTASMLFFVLAENTLEMLVGWELVGLCSFALIGHWWEEKPNSDAALKAFLTNRVGDVGLLIGIITLYFGAGRSFDIIDINTAANNGGMSHTLLLVSACCLIAAVMSKSGQFILHTWLPDAMAGPTPVSALIHAATMVVAGIYMVARLYPVFFHGLSIGGSSVNLLAIVGSVTALFGALLAFVQRDIKKVLAYSTVSQLGFMVTALGVGAWTAALFHLLTHAMFKACLFLGAGSLSHACHHSFDMVDDMGGLRKIMPKTFATYVVATLALSGIVPFAGFWSKDEILAGTGGTGAAAVGTYYFALIMLLIAAFCTAAYMMRTIWYAFFGEYRGHGQPHESGPRITIPLIILATMATIVGFANFPFAVFGDGLKNRFEHFVEPVGVFFPGASQGFTHAAFNWPLAGVGLLAGLGGLFVVYLFYWTDALRPLHDLASRNRPARLAKTVLENKYYLDWLYTDVIVGFVKGALARGTYWFNQNVLDGIVDGAGRTAVRAGRVVYDKIDQAVVDGTVNGIAAAADSSGEELSAMQTGYVQQYAALFFAAAALIAGVIAVWIGG